MATRRRGRGEGGIRQRKEDGLWVGSASAGYDPETGKRRRRTVYGRTKRECLAKVAELTGKVASGGTIERSRTTVGAYLAWWLEHVVRGSVRANTYASYEVTTRVHLVPHIGGVKLDALRPEHIQALYTAIQEAGGGARTRATAHQVLGTALAWAVANGRLERNPIEHVTRPRVPKREMLVWDIDQVLRFLEIAKRDRLYVLYLLAITTGLRQGELFGLRWEDIDLETARITVRRTLLETEGVISEGPPKTKRGQRPVDLPALAVDALRAHRGRMEAAGFGASYVFCDTSGGPLRKSNVRRRSYAPLLEAVDAAELELAEAEGRAPRPFPRIRFQDLRHTQATLLLAANVHPKIVQERLGHADIGVTLNVYSHALPSMQRSAADAIDAALRPKG